jgi:hypothetical protein
MPVGPFGMQDIAGIDVGARIRQYLASIGKSRAEGPQSAVPDRLYEMGRYGQKTGAGWYKYDAPGSRNRTPDPLVDEIAAEEAAKRGVTRRKVSDEVSSRASPRRSPTKARASCIMLLYQFDVIKGGADAKALIALSIMFPIYPVIGPLPLIPVPFETAQFVLPFPLVVLFNAAILTLAVPVALFAFNVSRRRFRFPAMFIGYVLPIAEAKNKYVWPMERFEDGERKLILFPGPSEDTGADFDRLAEAGIQEVWVTPKIPFLIPITASLVFSVVVGNLLFLFLS